MYTIQINFTHYKFEQTAYPKHNMNIPKHILSVFLALVILYSCSNTNQENDNEIAQIEEAVRFDSLLYQDSTYKISVVEGLEALYIDTDKFRFVIRMLPDSTSQLYIIKDLDPNAHITESYDKITYLDFKNGSLEKLLFQKPTSPSGIPDITGHYMEFDENSRISNIRYSKQGEGSNNLSDSILEFKSLNNTEWVVDTNR